MYCPQCGQVQSGEVRYCSRCGLALHEVSLWLGGVGELINPQAGNKQLSPQRKNIMRAAKVAFFSGIVLPFAIFVGAMDKEPAWFAIPLLVLFGSLVWMLYSRLFMDGSAPVVSKHQPSLRAEETNYLPPRRVAELEPPRTNTSEIVQPGSVTEYTTNLLRKREKNS